MRRLLLVFAGLLLTVAMGAPSASAITRSFINCPDGLPCSLITTAHIDTFGTAHLPWVISIPTPADACLAVMDIASDGAILITDVQPNGVVYRAAAGGSNPNGYFLLVPRTVAGWQTIEVDSEPPMGEQIVGQLLLKLWPGNEC